MSGEGRLAIAEWRLLIADWMRQGRTTLSEQGAMATPGFAAGCEAVALPRRSDLRFIKGRAGCRRVMPLIAFS